MKQLREWFGERTEQQDAYDSGFLSGIVVVAGLLVVHHFAERLRERRA